MKVKRWSEKRYLISHKFMISLLALSSNCRPTAYCKKNASFAFSCEYSKILQFHTGRRKKFNAALKVKNFLIGPMKMQLYSTEIQKLTSIIDSAT